jgi:site-specific DNA-cytosine methylase
MNCLELFSGTGSVGKQLKSRGHTVISLDLKGADINCDILKWNYQSYKEGDFDYIHASPPCDTFSMLRRSWIGRKIKAHGDTIITKEILIKDELEIDELNAVKFIPFIVPAKGITILF